jgi:hypothetical protein
MNHLEFSVLINIVRKKLNSGESLEELDYPDEDVAEALWIIQEETIKNIKEIKESNYEHNQTR